MSVSVAKWNKYPENDNSSMRMAIVAGVWVVGLIAIVLVYKNHASPAWNSFITFGLISVNGLMVLFMRMRAQQDLKNGLSAETYFEGKVSVRYQGQQAGADNGVIWIEDGLLRFKGLQTEFALPTPWVTAIVKEKESRHSGFVEVHCCVPSELPVTVRFFDLSRVGEPLEAVDQGWFYEDLCRWREGDSESETQAVYPPTRVDPSEGQGASMMWVFCIFSALFGLFTLSISVNRWDGSTSSSPFRTAMILFLISVCLGAEAIRLTIRYRRIKRLLKPELRL